jgi:hypothetical protein
MKTRIARTDRRASPINSKLEKSLTAYMAAAGAAGVGLLALAQPSEAKVVYTATNVTLTTPIAIDLNHDGVTDFTIGFAGYMHDLLLDVTPNVPGNAVRGNGSAACGFFGVPVGPGAKFATNSYWGHGVRMASRYAYGVSQSYGAWANVTNRYLGFKFLINGEVHYGWARVSVTNYLENVLLTGYAYETTPNTTIIEGHISGPSADNLAPADFLAPAQQPASLGMLARGADALSIWRRDDVAVSQ